MRDKLVKRVFSLILVVVFLMLTFVGCVSKKESEDAVKPDSTKGPQSEATASDEDLKLENYTEELKITAYLAGGCDPPISNKDCLLNKYFKEKFKINLDDITWPTGEDTENKINIMATSGDLPDVIQFWTGKIDVFHRLADAKLIMPVDELIDKYMPNFKSFNDPAVLDAFRNEKDGKLYVLPSFTIPPDKAEEYVKVNWVPFVRRDILKKTGMKSIDSLDDLYNFLKAAKQVDKDIIPMSVVEQELFGVMFGMEPYKCKVDHDSQRILNKWYLPEHLEALKYLARLFREELLDQEFYTTKMDDGIEKVKAGRVAFCFGSVGWAPSWFNPALKAKYPDDPDKVFDVIKMPRKEGLGKINYWTYSPYGWSMACISKTAKDPVRLAKFIDWSFTDYGNTVLWFGAPSKEGSYWYEEDGKIMFNEAVVNKFESGEITNNAGTWNYWFVHRGTLDSSNLSKIAIGYKPTEGDILADLAQELNKEDVYTDLKIENFKLAEKGPVAKEKDTNIQTLYEKWEADIVMRSKTDEEVESKYKEMVAELEQAGCIEVEKENYQIYMKVNK